MYYKYRPWNQFARDFLLKGELYIPSFGELNDPLEGEIIIPKDKMLARYAYDYARAHGVDLDYARKKLAELTASGAIDWERGESDIKNMLKRHCKVFSSSRNGNSLLMWAHYGDGHRGICIQLSEHFVGAVKSKVILQGNSVHYLNQVPTINPMYPHPLKEILIAVFTKTHQWAYEEEYRAVGFDTSTDKGIIGTIDKKFINAVTVGTKCPDEAANEIKSICAESGILFRKAQIKLGKIESVDS